MAVNETATSYNSATFNIMSLEILAIGITILTAILVVSYALSALERYQRVMATLNWAVDTIYYFVYGLIPVAILAGLGAIGYYLTTATRQGKIPWSFIGLMITGYGAVAILGYLF